MTKTFYDVLGVSADASTAEIRAAYRERLKESHPDLSDDDDANATTVRIIRARNVLTDEDERRRYDRVGHDEFVGNDGSPVDESEVSDAAAAARRAGWASDDSAREGTTNRSRAERRRRARERSRRERAAQERVKSDDGRGATRETGRGETASTDGGATETSGSGRGGVSESARSWNGSGGYSVRQRYDSDFQRSRLIPTGRSLSLLGVAFVLYPVMLFSALFPPFPLFVNVVVGLCAIFVVGYLQSIPEVGVVVFGVWSLATPVAFAVVGVPLTGLVGILGLTGTWLPLGLTVLTLALVPP